MELDDLVKKVNELLLTHKTVGEVEKALGYGKDSIRKKVGKAYTFNRKINQYVPKDNVVTDVVTVSYAPPSAPTPVNMFNADQLEILHKIIREYQAREHIQESKPQGTIVNRNIRVYKEQYDQFASFCKANNITQADALYKAIGTLLNNLD